MTERLDADTAPARPAETESSRPAVPGYEILEELGRGGMGVVYKARAAAANRLVALKMIRDGALAGAQEWGRFRIECEAAARMQHANIVQIYEIGDHAGRLYLAMQFVEGGSLAEWIADCRQRSADLSLPAARLLLQVAHAVHHAHERGIVHRDLKPANILLETVARTGPAVPVDLDSVHPVLVDFGLAKRLDSDSTAWTQEGAVVGTASYMAPEQAEGRIGGLGPGVDVYALGAILYELLTGQPPFRAGSWNQLIQQVLHDEPVPPRRLCPQVSRDLETICLKCLEKDPVRRYSSAGELGDDLHRFLEGRSLVAVPPGRRERLAREAARDGYEIMGEIVKEWCTAT